MNKYTSSTGSGDLSLTIKGFLVSVIPLVITLGQLKGVQFTETQLMDIVNAITAGLSTLMICYGLMRKIYYFVKNWYISRKLDKSN